MVWSAWGKLKIFKKPALKAGFLFMLNEYRILTLFKKICGIAVTRILKLFSRDNLPPSLKVNYDFFEKDLYGKTIVFIKIA